MTNDDYQVLLKRLAATWLDLRRADPDAAASLLGEALEHGVESIDPDTLAPERALPGARRRRFEAAVMRAAGAFDAEGYLAHEISALDPGTDAYDHFCSRGWRSMANPSLDFDVWWYRFEYLGLDEQRINPLVHYLLHGRHRGALPRPEQHAERTPAAASSPRRICLFAGYDVDGVVDDYVVAYLRELSRFADVYYLADGHLSDDQLARLAPVTRGAWARRHRAYDFGSIALLADELVGWDVIDTYDELLIANDSGYLLRPLDEVFARMDATPCDWWGLQATKRDVEGPPGHGPALTDDQTHALVGRPEWHQVHQLHVSSYLLCLRAPAFREPGVRRLLAAVVPEKLKSQVILKYEIGLSRVLLAAGHRFATLVEGLYPYHPLYTADFFDLAADGFPLLKRNFISDNARDAPDLARWKERVLEAAPEADVEMFERNLLRVTADDRLHRSLSITTRPDGTVEVPTRLTDEEVLALDAATPTYDHWWAFPVCAYDHTFAGNERAVFEEIRNDPSIKKIVLTRSRRVEVSGENVVVVPLLSPEGQWHAVRSRFVFVKHAPRINLPYPLVPEAHDFVNLWHGIPLKRFGMASLEAPAVADTIIEHHRACRSVITSSAADTLAMAAAFYPLTTSHMWQTGLPRNDFVVRPTADLPADLAAQRERLIAEVDGRRLVMFLPTFKKDQADAYYRFTPEDLERLEAWMRRHDAVLGIREHMADQARVYSSMLAPLNPINLSSRRYPDLEVLYAAADALISDYSSCLVDFMLTGKPVLSFAYDLERYSGEERGLFYDLDEVLPGPVCRTAAELADALDDVFTPLTAAQREEYDWKRRLFFEHLDDGNARRVVRRVKELALGR
ncbi:CDP-glycerol glycerophosphotransferase family protein [Nocardioides sp. GXZ039]|uniref:CDP-glycerol glycerophosphotransferase family protein n=1 Tax=Nocardioides sp. GXZ039 TaxID=3136018 RepID=UPI0030F3C8E6